MTCYSPLTAYKLPSLPGDKNKISFKRPSCWNGKYLDLPCGQCIGCRLERSRQWAVRCMHEASLYTDNSFLTLTYDDEHLPYRDGFCDRCVVPHLVAGSVCVSDFQDFMKRLRKSIAPKRVRYYHCGEYGETLGRPHYHALLFGHSFSDKKFFSSRGENSVYTSEELSRLWPQGFAVVGEVTFDSAAYVARYCLKKVTGDSALSHYAGRKPEYVSMSRRPGIGRGWYDKFSSDVYPLDRLVVNGKDTRPPRFYDRLFEASDRSAFEKIKIDRELNSVHYVDDFLSDGTHLRVLDSSPSRLRVKEVVKLAEISSLKRPLEVV